MGHKHKHKHKHRSEHKHKYKSDNKHHETDTEKIMRYEKEIKEIEKNILERKEGIERRKEKIRALESSSRREIKEKIKIKQDYIKERLPPIPKNKIKTSNKTPTDIVAKGAKVVGKGVWGGLKAVGRAYRKHAIESERKRKEEADIERLAKAQAIGWEKGRRKAKRGGLF